MPQRLAPGVYFEPADRSRRGIPALRTDVAAFVGIAASGPLDRPVKADSWEQFRTVFGDPVGNGFLAYAARAFFENGGREAFFVRVAADGMETASAAPALQPADRRSSVVLRAAGFVAGAVVTVRQDGLVANHLLQSVDPLGQRLVWEQPLSPDFNLLLPMAFATGAATASAGLLDAAGRPTLRVTAADPGAWGDEVTVRVSRASLAATASAPRPQPPDRRAVLVRSVVGFGPGTLVRLFQAEPARAEAFRVLREADAATGRLGWDEPLPAGFDLTAPAARPLSFETVELSLAVLRRGRVEEVFPGLSPVPEHPRSVERALAGSRLVRAEDLQREDPAPTPWPDRLPDPAQGRPPGLVRLAGGRDGIAALTAARFVGEPGSEERRGLRALETVDEVAMVAMPDLWVRPAPPVVLAPLPPPPSDPCALKAEPLLPVAPPLPPPLVERAPVFPLEEAFEAQQALVAHCETLHDRVALLDPPRFEETDEASSLGAVQAWRARFDSSFAALYYPWVRVADPRARHGGLTRELPPSGHVAGLVARTDLAAGVHKAPANEELRWLVGLTAEVSVPQQEVLNPSGINCLRAFPGRGLRVYGARTLASDTRWRYLPVRRLLLMIEEALDQALQWAVFEPHDLQLRQAIRQSISSFLTELWAGGALAGSTPAQAFFVRCDAETNPQEEVDLGRLIALVGVAPTVPAEFVVVRIGRTEEGFEFRERDREREEGA
ncbi:MAG TPA: phage tail sheath subtilisin-like domain-containing protein [Thermoanaerobaculia bacterium]|nr:phage tail sheath subtilisin-like domain-containing protein [Thermoanaerobaculia bacterium]